MRHVLRCSASSTSCGPRSATACGWRWWRIAITAPRSSSRRRSSRRVASGPYNTDSAEAVFAGLAACIELPWRDGAYRTLVLVGDAPPHTCGANAPPFPDRFPDQDPSGYTLDSMANRLEEDGIFVHALAMMPSINRHHDEFLARSFERLAVSTGGTYQQARTAEAAMAIVETVSKRFLRELDFDRKLYAALGDEERRRRRRGASSRSRRSSRRQSPTSTAESCASASASCSAEDSVPDGRVGRRLQSRRFADDSVLDRYRLEWFRGLADDSVLDRRRSGEGRSRDERGRGERWPVELPSADLTVGTAPRPSRSARSAGPWRPASRG